MPVTVNNTPGDSAANSYASLADLKTYRDGRFPAIVWAATATDDQLSFALLLAAVMLDSCFDWTGAATDSVQALAWPRNGMVSRNGFALANNVIPPQLKNAQGEWALQLGNSDLLADNAAAQQGVSSVKAGSVEVAFQSVNTSTPASVDMIIRRLGSELLYVSNAVPQAVRMLLVGSWFNQPSIQRPIFFKSF